MSIYRTALAGFAIVVLTTVALAQTDEGQKSAALSPIQQQQLRQTLERASSELADRDFDAAEKLANRAAELAPDTAPILNLYGAIATERENYDEARTYFEKALAKQPNYFPAEYNLVETRFMEKEYSEAASRFIDLLVKYPENELLEYKIFLAFLLMDRPEDADKWLGRIKYPGETPAWYYAQAAKEVSEGNKKKAHELLDGARYIFKGQTQLYDQSLKDVGLYP